ncbi:MAG: hypothetical protein GOU98_03870 [Candidatus Altiarchaeota archaeon]|nr:hypothetical protein [Candidatus Altiarchaeota archaeon]
MKLEDDFIQVNEEKKLVTVTVNPLVFPIDLVYNAAYLLMDRSYIILDGSPSEKIYVIMKPRTYKGDLVDLGRMFYDELVASAFHAVQFVRNKEMREALMSSIAPATESCDCGDENCTDNKNKGATKDDEDDEEFDEKDIATIWEDKFGESREGDKKTK